MSAYNKYTDEQLIKYLSDDDAAAFTALYNRYWEKLLAKALFLLGEKEDAEEAIHDLFVSLWKRRHHIELRYSFATYISASLRYAIYSLMAKKKQKSDRMLYLEEAAVVQLVECRDNSALQSLEFEEVQDKIERSISALPEKCQLVFRLSREEGLSEKEIARHLSISAKTVQNHMTTALKKLRGSLGLTLFLL